MNVFGKRLRALREEHDLLAKELAKRLNVEPASITNWETGSRLPKYDSIMMISKIFGVSTDFLLGSDLSEDEPFFCTDESKFLNTVNVSKELNELIRKVSKAKTVTHSNIELNKYDVEYLLASLKHFSTTSSIDVRMRNKK